MILDISIIVLHTRSPETSFGNPWIIKHICLEKKIQLPKNNTLSQVLSVDLEEVEQRFVIFSINTPLKT